MAQQELPNGWAVYQTAEGRQYFANVSTGETTWERPVPTYAPQKPPDPPYTPSQPSLAEGWAAYQTPEGRTYYANVTTGETSWVPPEVPACVPQSVEPVATAATPAEGPPAPHWSVDYTYSLGPEGCECNFQGKAVLLDKVQCGSVAATVDAMNAGVYTVEAGFCVIFSSSKQQYFLLWRSDKEQDAFARLDIRDAAVQHTWAAEQARELGPIGCEHLFHGRAILLDPSVYRSVTATVEALNAGTIHVDQGLCVIYSESKHQYFLLWHSGKQHIANSWLENVAPVTAG